MVYLDTGGSGFIGSRIVGDLIKEGKQVVVYDLFPEGSHLNYLFSSFTIECLI